ncbi:MAG: (Fe-S)-binding protein [Myxococcota bacterium]
MATTPRPPGPDRASAPTPPKSPKPPPKKAPLKKKAPTLASHGASYELCLYCPSLCQHACPVATVEGHETFTPQRLMSLAAHVPHGRVTASADVVKTLFACSGCGACTSACNYENPVADALVEARASLADAGETPVPAAVVERPTLPADHPVFESLRQHSRYEERPAVSLVPGRGLVEGDPTAIDALFGMVERLDVEPLACGELARIDPGYELWFFGHHKRFAERAQKVAIAARGARDIVVWSPETLYLLQTIYPRFGIEIDAAVAHVSEYLLPVLSGAVVKRLSGRVGYHESCHLKRHTQVGDVPRQVLKRVLSGPLIELPARADIQGCCGGSGLEPLYAETAAKMADASVLAARELGIERLVSFSPECVAALRLAAARLPARAGEPALRVDHAVTLVAEAVIGDGVG